jgi:hypothetical protein
MNETKQIAYSWDSKTNATEQETRDFANYLLGLVGNQPRKFEIAPKWTEETNTFKRAVSYVNSLEIDGKTGWRLPTKEELIDIYNSDNDFTIWYYMSSTEDGGDYAYCHDFSSGGGYMLPKNYGGFSIRAVRDI